MIWIRWTFATRFLNTYCSSRKEIYHANLLSKYFQINKKQIIKRIWILVYISRFLFCICQARSKLVTSQTWKLLVNVEKIAQITRILPLMFYILKYLRLVIIKDIKVHFLSPSLFSPSPLDPPHHDGDSSLHTKLKPNDLQQSSSLMHNTIRLASISIQTQKDFDLIHKDMFPWHLLCFPIWIITAVSTFEWSHCCCIRNLK
jgi:hypothetical protein